MYDELVKRLRNRRICIQQSGSLDDFPLLREAADAIEELQADKAALNGTVTNLLEQIKDLGKPRWIPVTERLPEDLKFVLVVEDGIVFVAHCGHYYGEEETFVEWHDTMYYPVSPTHWMPLPQPPKEE